MNITMTELALLIWGVVATAMWHQARNDLKFYRMVTSELMRRIARGEMKVVESDGHFDFKEV